MCYDDNRSEFTKPVTPHVEKVAGYLRQRPVRVFRHADVRLYKGSRELIEEEATKEIEATQASRIGLPKREKKKIKAAIKKQIEDRYRRVQFCEDLLADINNLSCDILDFLRTPGVGPAPNGGIGKKDTSEKMTFQLLRDFPEVNKTSCLYLGEMPDNQQNQLHPVGANYYFEQTQLRLVEQYGLPFITTQTEPYNPLIYGRPRQEHIVDVNTHFFAAFLGGDKRFQHSVVFYLPENRYYYYDPFSNCYYPTTAKKLLMGLSQIIINNSWGMKVDEAQRMVSMFQIDSILNEILTKAEVLLLVEQNFFEGPDANVRFVMNDIQVKTLGSTLKSFVEEKVENNEASILTITECMAGLGTYAKESGACLPGAKDLKEMLQSTVREIYSKGLRNDLVLPDNTCVTGWKGLRLRAQGKKPAADLPDIDHIRESGDSEVSDPVPDLGGSTMAPPEMVLLS